MSEAITTAIASARGLAADLGLLGAGWRARLRPGSFRGAPFFCEEHTREGGRRVAAFEYPQRDAASTEDLGRAIRKFSVSAYVIGPDYMADRDALLAACEETGKPGLLVHPYLGELTVRCEGVSLTETKSAGGMATFKISFVEAGDELAPTVRINTVGQVLAGVRSALRVARLAFAAVYAVRGASDYLSGVARSYVDVLSRDMSATWLGLPGLELAGARAAVSGLASADVTDAAGLAAAVTAPGEAIAAAAAAAPAGQAASGSDAGDELGQTVTSSRGETGPAAGWVGRVVLSMAAYADPAPAVVLGGGLVAAQEAANRQALDDLVRGSAVAAAARIFAETAWPSADAAAAARADLVEAIVARMDAAADAGADELFAAWRQLLAAVAEDLTQRGQRRPRLGRYAVPGSLPSLVLAYRLLQDARRADELVALNGAAHPAWMPAAGQVLRS